MINDRTDLDRLDTEVIKDISRGDIPKVFNPFFTTRSEETGLGLSIVDRLVHAWGGDIGVESEPGEGTTFTLRLPDASE